MDVRAVDPRDTEFEISDPIYRVYFWQQQASDAGVAVGSAGWSSDEYELTGASGVPEVMHWAKRNAAGRTFTLHIVVNKTLVRLLGDDPTHQG